MFTGIIEEMGTLKARKDGAKSSTLTIQASKVLEGTQIGKVNLLYNENVEAAVYKDYVWKVILDYCL